MRPARGTTVARGALAALAAVAALGACGGDGPGEQRAAAAGAVQQAAETTTTSSTSTTAAPTTTTTAPPTTTTAAPKPKPAPVRPVVRQDYTPFAAVAGITLVHPASVVERVGFHQSNHEGAQTLAVLPTAAAPVTLESRERLTAARTAADVVVDPAVEIRAPVTGVVKRAGTYTLYCRYTDVYVVIAPDAHPDWEVKLLHMVGLRTAKGQRVVAGRTLVAAGAHKLPFESQVDELAPVAPPWPHVHIEVVDPSIPNKPSPGGGCS